MEVNENSRDNSRWLEMKLEMSLTRNFDSCLFTLEQSATPSHKWKVVCDGSLHCWMPLLQVPQGDVTLVDECAGVRLAAAG